MSMQDHSTSTKIPYMLKMNVFTLLDDCPSILDQVQVDLFSKHRRKYVQVVAIFHLLTHGCPMTYYEDLKNLFQINKVKSVSSLTH
jgi:hypothetical protein